jgi:alkylation response protein AidB-like acyl-CoA dehydrogenase
MCRRQKYLKNKEAILLTAYRNDLKPFKDLARSFASKELAGKTEEHDRYPFGDFFEGVLDKAYEVGFLNVVLPEALGGIGCDIGTLCVILQNICQVDSSIGGIIFTNAMSQQIMLAAGSKDLTQEIFTKASSAREFLVAFPSYTDPVQTDLLPMAEMSGNEYKLTGRLELLVMGNMARHAIIPARTGKGQGYAFFLIDLSVEGVDKSPPVITIGLHACPAVDINLQGVKAKLLGVENAGINYFEKAYVMMNVAAAAMNAGIMRGSLNEAMAYSRERFQGGRAIADWSEVSMILAGMSVKTDVADMCVVQSCLGLCQSEDENGSRYIACSTHIHELACETVTDGIQILGGYGYMKDYGQEKRFRDARMVQGLLGTAPMKKLAMIRNIAEHGMNNT